VAKNDAVRCADCRQIVRRYRARQKVELYSRTYAGGTLSDVALQKRIDEWLCDSCVMERKLGGQARLL
jgi:hypothetical protein